MTLLEERKVWIWFDLTWAWIFERRHERWGWGMTDDDDKVLLNIGDELSLHMRPVKMYRWECMKCQLESIEVISEAEARVLLSVHMQLDHKIPWKRAHQLAGVDPIPGIDEEDEEGRDQS